MGILYIVSTPIGNLEDISIRAIKTLFSVAYIACEDTRKTGLLLAELRKRYTYWIGSDPEVARVRSSSTPRLISFYDEIEVSRTPEVIDLLEQGKNVALVSDAGTPLISDPGFKLVRECIKSGIKIVPIPGSSALITALTVSGLPPDKFLYLGYLPEKKTKRLKVLEDILSSSRPYARLYKLTIIIFESPHRLKSTLDDIKAIFGDIEIVIARELTKIHEEIWSGKISDSINYFKNPKGEFVLLFKV